MQQSVVESVSIVSNVSPETIFLARRIEPKVILFWGYVDLLIRNTFKYPDNIVETTTPSETGGWFYNWFNEISVELYSGRSFSEMVAIRQKTSTDTHLIPIIKWLDDNFLIVSVRCGRIV